MSTMNTDELVEVMFTLLRLMKHKMSFTSDLTHLSILQIQALMCLSHSNAVTMSDIAAHFRIELPSATSLINKLCDQKLVRRYEDPQDRRLVKVALTAEGKALLEKAMSQRRNKVKKMLSYLSAKERAELLSILNTLNTKMQNIS